ncbi:hypothetical protein [Streptomyces sp. NPDC055506]
MLVAAAITYNAIEVIVAITAGTRASSTALIGFGLDSIIEVSSAAAVAWQFSSREHAVREARENAALRIIALSFFALAAYVSVDAVRALTGSGEAERSVPGIVPAGLIQRQGRAKHVAAVRGATVAVEGPPRLAGKGQGAYRVVTLTVTRPVVRA